MSGNLLLLIMLPICSPINSPGILQLALYIYNIYLHILVCIPTLKFSFLSGMQSTLGAYFTSVHCPLCGQHTEDTVCRDCRKDKQKLFVLCAGTIKQPQQKLAEIRKVSEFCLSLLPLQRLMLLFFCNSALPKLLWNNVFVSGWKLHVSWLPSVPYSSATNTQNWQPR